MKYKIALLFLCLYSFSIAQVTGYGYKRALTGITDKWHCINLPDDIFRKVQQELSDIRIIGVSKSNDTIEVPYMLRVSTDKVTPKELTFSLINQSKNTGGYYYTLELNKENSINEIHPDFKQDNFDWKVKVEGSQNQKEWYSIIDNYRILSIKNSLTDYKFTTINFPTAKFRFFRLHVKSNNDPELLSTKIQLNDSISGMYRNYLVNAISTHNDKTGKQTIIEVKLKNAVPVSFLKIAVINTNDYYRPVTIQYLTDSTKSPKGWIYNFNTLAVGTLNSLEKNEFKFNSTTLQRLKILIDNQDNAALAIQSVSVKGFEHQLIARFDTGGTYYLIYGNKNAVKPNYEIEHFSDKIPENLGALEIGNEQVIKNEVDVNSQAPFQNKLWLWVIMGLIILILGWFSLKMIEKK